LRALVQKDGLLMGEIASLLSIRPPTASKMIARMSQQGLLERRGQDGDARVVAVFITEEGLRRAQDLNAIARKVEKEALDGLDSKDERRLRKLLKRMARNLDPQEASEEGADLEDEEDEETGAEVKTS
jgi:DNA-binding MarR family transcriptional regulator